MYPRHSSVAAAVNYRKVRQSTFENFNQTAEVPFDQIKQEEIKDDEFETAFKTIMRNELETRSNTVQNVCEKNYNELSWSEEDLLQQLKHKDVWDIIHGIVFCPIAKVFIAKINYNYSFAS